ncbi:SprT family zinc-dependent metalloprotease [Pseudohongiella nitratireducens]|uniref:M48 family metallopeptidase n=1 Tax=Pseudohongiella nitratireducens TaxID=1768907 RepID=UPI0030EBC8CC
MSVQMKAMKVLLRRQPDHEILELEYLPVPCELKRSQRKSLAVHVSHNRVEVRAPLRMKRTPIELFVQKHQRWIRKKLKEKQRKHAEKLTLAAGRHILYKAQEWQLVIRDQRPTGVVLEPGRFCIQAPGITDPKAKKILTDWLKLKAKEYLPARTQALAQYLGVDHKLKEVVFRKTRSKWGHCTSEGRIQYNWLIMLAPDGVIDYMICHEVCHLLHMNHSPAFWDAVASVCPDYQRYVGWLKANEHRLWF